MLEAERRNSVKKEQRRVAQERKELRIRERESANARKAADRAAREATKEERRQKKLLLRMEREKFAQEQKNAALRRCAELVQSNRVPIEITRGAAAAQAAANAAVAAVGGPTTPMIDTNQKKRSAIVVSTAQDLHQIVSHSKNLWTKYNAIAKEHNQKVNWIVVAKELGIRVKVREKYASMHSRAEQRGFDWVKCGHYRIKDHPQIFLEPTQAEQKAKMPPPSPNESRTVLIEGTKEVPTPVTTQAYIAFHLPEEPVHNTGVVLADPSHPPPMTANPTAAPIGVITTPAPPPLDPASVVVPAAAHVNPTVHHPQMTADPIHTTPDPKTTLDDKAAAAAAAAAAAQAAAQAAEAVDIAIKSDDAVKGSAAMADAFSVALAAAPANMDGSTPAMKHDSTVVYEISATRMGPDVTVAAPTIPGVGELAATAPLGAEHKVIWI